MAGVGRLTRGRGLAALMILAALARLALIAADRARFDDPDNYLPLARSLAEGRGLEMNGRLTAYRPPLYPVVLAPIVLGLGDHWRWGVALLHAVLGAATVYLTAESARRLGMTERSQLLVGFIVALDPVLAIQGRSVMTETLAAALVSLTLLGLSLPGASGGLLGGLGFGLSALCRPSLLPAAGVSALAELLWGTGTPRQRALRSGSIAFVTLLCLLPWAWRNSVAVGEWVWTTTHGGYTLALANNPVYARQVLDGPPGAVWSGPDQTRWQNDIARDTIGLPEPVGDRMFRDAAIAYIRSEPRTFARASAARLGRFWGVAPAASVYPAWQRLATAAWTVPFWLCGLSGLLCRKSWRLPRLHLLIIVVCLTTLHAIYWTDLRMRAPLIPALALVASAGWRGRAETADWQAIFASN